MDTLIGRQSEIIGDIKFSGGLHIEGTVKGNVTAANDDKSLIQLSETGTIEGEVKAPFVVLNGVIIGDVHGSEHIDLAPKARITGNVYYGLIEMSLGAEVNGKLVHMQTADDMAMVLDDGKKTDDSDGRLLKEFDEEQAI